MQVHEMGLDMYLNAKRFLWHSEDELADKVSEVFTELGDARVKEITAEVMYWRKSNAIHKWFVDNVQDGTDECQESWVERKHLEALLAVIDEVLVDREKALLLLPPQSGFFFGSKDVDDWYWEDLVRTKKGLEDILSKEWQGWDFYYRASW
jgi:hypothetical protein